MRVLLHKRSNEQHVLEIVRADGTRERVECATRSYLRHDLMHFAVEAEAKLDSGFWGNLARGKTLGQMNDRTGRELAEESPGLMAIERVVGALSGAVSQQAPEQVVSTLHDYERALGEPLAPWLSAAVVEGVHERMRKLLGQWKATPFGAALELRWPPLD